MGEYSNEDIVLEPELAATLLETGFIALNLGENDKAGLIFDAIQLARPDQEGPPYGKALTLAAVGRLNEAQKFLEREIKERPEGHDQLLILLSIFLCKSKRLRQARQILEQVGAEAKDTKTKKLAGSLLEDDSLWK